MFSLGVRSKLKLIRRSVLSILVTAFVCLAGWGAWRYHGPAPEQEIYHGIFYGCQRLPETAQSGGLLHWIRADLKVPGVRIFVTPLDAGAVAQGAEYKLRYTSAVVKEQGLAAAVNGTLFASHSSLFRFSGDLARATETVISDHKFNHIDPNSYLLWWGDDGVGHLQTEKPPTPSIIRQAKWGIGSQQMILIPTWKAPYTESNWRTVIGIDPGKNLVWLTCFDKSSFNFAANTMAELGAKFAVAIDGGSSMAMAVGPAAKNVRSGTITGNWQPVVTHFGFYADPLP